MLNKVLKNITNPVFILSLVAFMIIWQAFLADLIQVWIIDRFKGGEEA